jgi:hypothetical protein
MNPELEKRLSDIEFTLNNLVKKDRYLFQKGLEIFNGLNITFGRGLGTKIGTSATQKIGFWNAPPVVQAGAIGAPSTPSALYSQSEAQTTVTAVNSLRTVLKNAGFTA